MSYKAKRSVPIGNIYSFRSMELYHSQRSRPFSIFIYNVRFSFIQFS